ncbi:hypothetical protein D3C81_1455590 [compost metagenome]
MMATSSTSLVTNIQIGATSNWYLSWVRRSFHSCQIRRRERTRPRRTVRVWRLPPPNQSGIKPELIRWNDFGNGAIDWPPSTIIVKPRNSSIPANVTIKAGIFT